MSSQAHVQTAMQVLSTSWAGNGRPHISPEMERKSVVLKPARPSRFPAGFRAVRGCLPLLSALSHREGDYGKPSEPTLGLSPSSSCPHPSHSDS